MNHHNRLTPAEAERLAMLAEECAEVIQAIGKILRHGYDSYHPLDPDQTPNRVLLDRELTDVAAVVLAMRSHGDIALTQPQNVSEAWSRKLKFAHHQGFSA